MKKDENNYTIRAELKQGLEKEREREREGGGLSE